MEKPDTAVKSTDLIDGFLSFLNCLPDSRFFPLWVEGSLDSLLLVIMTQIEVERDCFNVAERLNEANRKHLKHCFDYCFDDSDAPWTTQANRRAGVFSKYHYAGSDGLSCSLDLYEFFASKTAFDRAIEKHKTRCTEFEKLVLRLYPDGIDLETDRMLASPRSLYPDLSRFSE